MIDPGPMLSQEEIDDIGDRTEMFRDYVLPREKWMRFVANDRYRLYQAYMTLLDKYDRLKNPANVG